MAIALRNGKELCKRISNQALNPEISIQSDEKEIEKDAEQEIVVEESAKNLKEKSQSTPTPPPLFPQCFQKQKLDKQFQRFLERKLEEFETVALTEECSAIIHNKLPPKLKDLESFSIPCTIGSFKISKALCDLGASVSIMSLSIAKKLGFQEIQPTTVTLQLANRTIRHSIGIIEDVLLKVGHLCISVDFIVLKIEYDVEIPLILGRPCLATAGALIDVKNGKITFRVGEEEVVFNLFNATQYPYTDSCYKVDLVNKDKSKPIPPPSTE
ncbi:PREDICTED: uncharacterized protein LOC108661976 [Theobroma cacao]|uniref:Uncharacterized protein LOC108661976 n=1 Tax=Theobroma cacao TaxID=3641 RepID=A0AB32WCD1_THECC|nr:PREDICTED: uncharacterized protein LOC108661976 [Theobroma cacao]